jgi:hypothetical protein
LALYQALTLPLQPSTLIQERRRQPQRAQEVPQILQHLALFQPLHDRLMRGIDGLDIGDADRTGLGVDEPLSRRLSRDGEPDRGAQQRSLRECRNDATLHA